ncbi:MAG: branched-chain amino acid ABC transporter substrate-binding protein [bacterium]
MYNRFIKVNIVPKLLLTGFIGILLFACHKGRSDGKEIIKLGVVLPLTGPPAAAGIEMFNSVKLAVEEWNSAARIPGYKIVAEAKDDAADPKQAVASAHSLMSDSRVYAVVAHLNSGCFLPASRIYHDYGVAAMSGAATNPEITLQGYPEIFRICTTDLVQGQLIVPYLLESGTEKMAIIHDKTQYGQGLAEVVKKAAQKSKIKIVSFDGINVGDKDFKAILTRIKDLDPDTIYFGGMYDEAGLIVRQMRDLGMKQRFTSDDGVFGKDFVDAGGREACEGSLISMVGVPINDLTAAREYINNYQKEFGVEVQNYGPYAYDVANILLTAISRVIEREGKPKRKAIINELKTIKYKGVIGETSFDKNGDTNLKVITIYRVENGKFKPVKTQAWRNL